MSRDLFRAIVIVAPVLLLALAACDDDSQYPPLGGDPPRYPFPASPEVLMANVETAYELADLVALRRILHADHVTVLQPATTALYPALGDTIDRPTEMAIHENLFSGRPGSGRGGAYVPPVAGIDIRNLTPAAAWQEWTGSGRFAGLEFADHDVEILVDRGAGETLLRISGVIRLFATARDSVIDGVVRSCYQLAGQVDLTDPAKDASTVAWGTFKAMYAPSPE